MKLPKVPDILKVPEKSDLDYSKNEFNALNLEGLIGNAFFSNMGAEFITESIPKILRAPLGHEDLHYRQEWQG